MKYVSKREFTNGVVYCLKTNSGHLIETTDTFLPFYTKDAIGRKQNFLSNSDIGSRKERWMIGISTMSSCPVRCKFCATGNMKMVYNLTAEEIIEQIDFVLSKNPDFIPLKSQEFKINMTRMGEPFLNIKNVRSAIEIIQSRFSNAHIYISTIGIKNADFSWIKDNITLQISLHSLDNFKRDWLIPYKNKMTIEELGAIRTNSYLKTTLNLTLVDESDFDIEKLKAYFDPKFFFVKLSPINKNEISIENHMGDGIIEGVNLL